MTIKYALFPGPVRSRRDGQYHYIHEADLARLYGVRMSDCLVVRRAVNGPNEWREREMLLDRIKEQGLIELRPRYDGNYTLPTK